MESSERIQQDSGANAKPHCFKGHGGGKTSVGTDVRGEPYRDPRDGAAYSKSSHDDDAEPFEDAASALNPEAESAACNADRFGEFGAPNEKIAALRKVLDEMNAKVSESPETEAEDVRSPEPARPTANRSEHHHESSVSLFRRTDHLTDFDTAREREGVPVAFTIADLRRSHMNRAKSHARAMQRRNTSGSFLTGLVLMSAVTATMVGLYVMHPQIITAQPQLAPALNEYVETVDRYRAVGEERSAEWKQWLSERIGNLSKAKQ